MKRSKLVALTILISLFLIPLVPPKASAASSYTEKINVYVAGPNAAWFINVGGVNVTDPRVQSAEAIAGLSSYNLTAIRSTSWNSDFQVFGQQGYKVLPVPFVPPEGAFLTVGAASFSDASSAASKLGSYLLTTFQSTGNASGSYSFFAPVSFPEVIPLTILRLVPFANGGFLANITSTSFLGLSSPMVSLSGQKTSGGGFVHQVSIGSITAAGLDSTSKPNILSYFGQAKASIVASNKSSSSVIAFHFLDGLVVSQDGATITTNRAAFSSTYTVTLKPGAKVSGINATVVQQPAELLATRVVDVGVLRTGTNMSVTVNLNNLSNSTILTGVRLDDNWWQSVGGFKLVRGNSSILASSIGAGQSTSPTYVLQYTGNATKQLQIPATPVNYTYVSGVTAVRGFTNLNPMVLSLGIDGPVVYAYVAPSSPLPTPVGGNQSLKVFVKNVGTRAASSLSVAGQQLGGLAADGGSATVSLSITAPSLTQVNVTKSYTVSYTTSGGQALNMTTNSIPIVFAHGGMRVGFGILALNSSLRQLPGGAGYGLTLTMALANSGPVGLTSFSSSIALPAGLACGKTSSNLTCSGGTLTLAYPLVPAGAKESATASFNVTRQSSFIFWPSSFTFRSSGYLLTGYSNGQPAPTGLLVSKVFSPSVFFPGMVSQITTMANNGGPFTIFNATLSTTADGFDSLSGNQSTVKSAQTLAAASNLNFSYSASISNTKGSQSAAVATVKFFMGGTPFSVSTSSPTVTFNKPLAATITTSPSSPTEGSPFTVTITVTNPSSVAVTGVKFVLPIPSGVKVTNYTNGCDCASVQNSGLSISVSNLAPGSTTSAQATVAASSGQTIPFKPGGLRFTYANQTLSGTLPSGGIAISENVTTRYLLPIGMAILGLFVVAYEVRKMAAPTAPSSQK